MASRQLHQPGTSERRRNRRVRIGPTTRMMVTSEADEFDLVDLSYSGCAVAGRHALSVGEEFHLTFTLDAFLRFLVPVRVRYSRPAPYPAGPGRHYLSGLEFVASRQPDIHRIVEMLLEVSTEPIGVH